MDFGRLETALTRALAWLLDKEEHGFGSSLLDALLRHLLDGRAIHLTEVEKAASEYLIQCGPSSLDAGRIDVLAEGRWVESGKEARWRLVIEAKIDAWEGEDQLSKYDDWIESNTQTEEVVRVFLTPDGRQPERLKKSCVPFSYSDPSQPDACEPRRCHFPTGSSDQPRWLGAV